ncbi:MAG: helix-turn-helix transcriptional regulator [Frankiaceae bacterium]|nr:helix-turn-helix transcriptional regulator [Frankiaceae bacterium]
MTQDAAGTRAAVLRAAEQLLAVGGIEGPSDREIIAHAGVGNKSAIHYHFGSRRGLVDAILAEHGEVLRVRRALAYERLVVGPGSQDLLGLCQVIVEPYATFLEEGPSQWAFLAVAQFVLEDPREDPMSLPERFHDPLMTVLALEVLDHLSLPDEIGAERARVGVGHVIASLGARARQQIAGIGGWTYAPLELFTPNLVDMLHGSLVAPPSTAALAAAG